MSTEATSAEKVAYEKVVRASVRMNNSVDASRVYDIEAEVNIEGGKANNVTSGTVKKEGTQVATFNSYGDNNLNINHSTKDEQERCAVTVAVGAFIEEVKNKVATTNTLALNLI